MGDETVLVGRVGAAHGIRGEVRVKSFTAPMDAIGDYGPLLVSGGGRLTVDRLRVQGDMLVVKFREVADRTAAEKLTNLDLSVPRSALPEPEDEETFYHADLIGLRVEEANGNLLGEIVTVPDFGAGDLLEVKPAGAKSFYLPFTKAIVPVVDVKGGRVVAELPEGFLQEAKPEAGEAGAEEDAGA